MMNPLNSFFYSQNYIQICFYFLLLQSKAVNRIKIMINLMISEQSLDSRMR